MATKKPVPKKTTAAAKATATKKAAPKKATASKSTAAAKAKSSTTTKKAAPAKKAPVKKAAATKKAAPAKKAPAKKAAATNKTTAKKAPATKAPAKKAAAKKAPAKKAAPKKKVAVKSPFKVRDKVVYPHHGAATIVKKERIEFDGEKQDYFVLELATDQLIVRVPVAKALDLGVRPVISKNMARKVFATFKQDPEEAGSNWSRWYKLLTEKINSGDIFQVAEVVRDLTYAQQKKGISPALKRMLAKARVIITSELRFALAIDEDDAIRRLDRALPKVEVEEDA